MENTFTYGITGNEAGMTVAEYLKSRGYSSRLVVRLRNTPGSFFVDGTAVFSTCVLKDGNQLQVRVAEKRSSAAVEPVPMDLDILYEDTHLLVVNKPAGMAVHPSQGNHGNTLANGLAGYFRKKQEAFVFRAVNRLDKDTSGLLLVAKNGLSSSLLSGQVSAGRSAGSIWPLSAGKQMPAEWSLSPSGGRRARPSSGSRTRTMERPRPPGMNGFCIIKTRICRSCVSVSRQDAPTRSVSI